ncbi:MAG: enoyl-CoA hydratase-related protein, partial [Acidimicrobiia bacterium]
LDLAIVDRPFDSAYALQIGLISEIVPDLELTDRASALATRLAAGPTGAYGRIKALLRQSFDHSLETQLDFETRAISVAAASPDGQEGVGAFLGKRQAKFGGAPLP